MKIRKDTSKWSWVITTKLFEVCFGFDKYPSFGIWIWNFYVFSVCFGFCYAVFRFWKKIK